MPTILTPLTLWNNFDDSLDISAVTLSERTSDGVKYETVEFFGRETGEGRVKIVGVFASDESNPSAETVLILPDSTESADEGLLKLFVKRGYSAFMVDYRGEWEGQERFTSYPSDVEYANTQKCGRHKDFVDESADKTSWYEWVAVGIYARKYIVERTGSENIALVGIRDGGEIAWKLAVASGFSCMIAVCAAGWKAYEGKAKYRPDEQELDDERYRFIGGIDSQAYAPYVKCPVLMLCSTNDPRFDYDRAYDTFSRINHDFAEDSIITYSVTSDASIGYKSISDMFLYLNKFLKHRQVFIPKTVDINVSVDADDNLIAKAVLDDQGIVEDCEVYMAEDCIDSSIRDWSKCDFKSKNGEYEREFFLNIYEKTTTLFVLCYARYLNGFTVWSKIAVKKISGKFRNMRGRNRVMFTTKEGTEGFSVAEPEKQSVGGIFLTGDVSLPEIVVKEKGIKGIYSANGLTTYRINNPKYAPESGNVLKLDVFCDETAEMTFVAEDIPGRETYKVTQSVLGGVWQSLILESKLFKTMGGTSLSDFTGNIRFSIFCSEKYAVNNVIWL